ncbi:hypothetical protein [Burkholderia cenocepacia]|jgi:CRISPR-associated exonuclease Cas4|uniref:PD-(D/E)XK endonuclease-like domain-containing protein n=1 Tax=Dechloromonas agitata TaxID=73030 RepID=A0A930BS43_9RHOO|nr:hypothetical protein [Burkholderia cenocepacia]MBF1164797.1 hypothetical protein [Dechloromonas agitata]MDI9689450.1 hypothetical protein [Burkholderia cenocepacia]
MLEVLLIVALLVLAAWSLHRWWFSGDRGWMPLELRRATLVYAEQLFRAPGRPMITAKVDRVYRRRDGRLVLVELKTRRINLAYLSDVIELSAQRVAIGSETGEDVMAHAYVVVQGPAGRRTTHKVKLLGAEEVRGLASRREAILAGTTRPRLAGAPGLRERCAFEKKCAVASALSKNTYKHLPS